MIVEIDGKPWRTAHKCPSCGRWFDSPSVCLGEPPRAWWRRPFRRDRHPSGAQTVECLVRVPRLGDE